MYRCLESVQLTCLISYNNIGIVINFFLMKIKNHFTWQWIHFFITNDEMKIWRKNKGRLILQHKLFKKFFLMAALKKLIKSLFV